LGKCQLREFKYPEFVLSIVDAPLRGRLEWGRHAELASTYHICLAASVVKAAIHSANFTSSSTVMDSLVLW
jgi:hypothetical protein